MALEGGAFLAIWHDIAEGEHGEYIEWHTREHMPERLSIPGFRTGKRLHDPAAGRYVFGTIYAGDDIEVFRSEAYLERLNAPTPWTAAVAPSFQNFLRIACERIATAGLGDGGSMATIRFDFTADDAASRMSEVAQPLAEAICALKGICCVHIGVARREVSGVRTRETDLRSAMKEREFDVVILAEGSVRAGLETALPEIERLASATGLLAAPVSAIYETAYSLTDNHMRRHP